MRHSFALFLLALGSLSVARADFSVVQTARMSVGEGTPPAQTLTVYQKGAKTRFDIGTQLTVILDTDLKRRTTLDRIRKTYRIEPYEQKPAPPPPGKITVTPTERKTTIAGHPARLFLWHTAMGDIDVTGELWAAEDIERVEIPSILGEGGFDPAAQNKGMKGHPLRIRLTTKVKNQVRGILTSEVGAISTKELPESYFDLPAGFVEEKKGEKPGIEPPPPTPG
jgi:hypothetical protein